MKPTGRPRKDVVLRFWEQVDKTDGCWNFRKAFRYAKIKTGPPEKRTISAHRFSWELHNGQVPGGLFVCHKCNNKRCVNPDHLYLATPKQNFDDALRDGLQRSWKGSLNPKWKGGIYAAS